MTRYVRLRAVFFPFGNQSQRLVLHLGAEAAEAGEFDARLDARKMPAGLHQRSDGPAHVAENFEVSDPLAIDAAAAGAFVGSKPRFTIGDPTRFERDVAETPGSNAGPSDVFKRIPDVRELPIEDCGQPGRADEDVTDPKIAVHERSFGFAGRFVANEPAQREVEGRLGLG